MQGPTVEIDINDEGVASIHVVGAKGPSCKKHLDAFKTLGNTIEEGKKPEFFKAEPNQNRVASVVRNG